MASGRSVLIPVDGSRHSFQAFHWYLQNLRKEGDHVIFLHVFNHLDNVPQRSGHESDETSECEVEDFQKIMDVACERAKPILTKYIEKCKCDMVPYKPIVKLGTPDKEIRRTAEKENACFIIMGSRGLGSFRRAVMGSCSTSVMHKSKIPVMVVPPQER